MLNIGLQKRSSPRGSTSHRVVVYSLSHLKVIEEARDRDRNREGQGERRGIGPRKIDHVKEQYLGRGRGQANMRVY